MPLETRVWRGSPVACVDRGAAEAEAGADGAPLPRSGRARAPPVSRRVLLCWSWCAWQHVVCIASVIALLCA